MPASTSLVMNRTLVLCLAATLAACDSVDRFNKPSNNLPSPQVLKTDSARSSQETSMLASESVAADVQLHSRAYAPVLQDFGGVTANTENYADSAPLPVMRVADAPVSTFSIDVDTGSYSNVRRLLNHGSLPPEDAVRIEEFINYFDYAYPDAGDDAFSVTTAMAPAPWNDNAHLLRIGIHGQDVEKAEPRINLVFLIDVSGSMASPDKLGLLTSSLSMLAQGLSAEDRVSIVTYAGAAGVVLDSAVGNDTAAIDAALSSLQAGGSTAGEAGIKAAYQLAHKNRSEGSVNRVILATDGDFNVGLSSVDSLLELIEDRRDSGIALSTLGFGTGNYNDHLMEQLADAGNGRHAYIDTMSEARKVLAEQLDGTLFTIARDVKVQMEFNPAVVSEYRLIGYDNRVLNEEDFNNDSVDAGDIGAGHTVTALYEIVLAGNQGRLSERRYATESEQPVHTRADELGELRLRFKAPGQTAQASQLIKSVLSVDAILPDLDDADSDFRFSVAVAAWGELMRDARYLGDYTYQDVRELASKSRGDDPFGYRAEFMGLVDLSDGLDRRERLSHGSPPKELEQQRDRG